jgi:DNA-binding LacI/PurR family transcriptional regulator
MSTLEGYPGSYLTGGLALDPDLIVQLQGDAPTHPVRLRRHAASAGQRAPLKPQHSALPLCLPSTISAIHAIRALREAGLRVPEDVSVIGFDDISSAAFQNSRLTTVRQPLEQMGVLAAQTVLRQIQDQAQLQTEQEARPTQHIVEPELVIRGSTGPVRR